MKLYPTLFIQMTEILTKTLGKRLWKLLLKLVRTVSDINFSYALSI